MLASSAMRRAVTPRAMRRERRVGSVDGARGSSVRAHARSRRGRRDRGRGDDDDFKRELNVEPEAWLERDETNGKRGENGVNGKLQQGDASASGEKKTKTVEADLVENVSEEAQAQEEDVHDFVASVVMSESEETFALQKKRMQLIIEEKEWELESPNTSEDDKMYKLVEYVNAVEAFKELCSSEVPNTVGDLLGQYVMVHHLDIGAPGYDEAMAFLGLDEEDEDEELDVESLKRLARMQVEYAMDNDDDDDSDDEDDGEDFTVEFHFENEDIEPLRGLHCAQDVEGNWRWLEDDEGRVLPALPFGDFNTKLMGVEYMIKAGLNVNSLHEEIDPIELLSFEGCKTWEETLRVMQEAQEALKHLEETGWKVDTRSWSSEQERLIVVKELSPLRTMSAAVIEAANEDDQEQDEN